MYLETINATDEKENLFTTVAIFFRQGANMDGSERRKYPRFDIDLALKNVMPESPGEFSASTTDISAKGIGCVADTAVPLGTRLDIRLYLPDGDVVRTEGSVVWIGREGSRYRMGVDLIREELKAIPIVLRTLQMRTRHYA
jgi:hypothetical protein